MRRQGRTLRPPAALMGIGLAIVLVAGSCTGGGSGPTATGSPASGATPPGSGATSPSSATIPQPALGRLNDLTRDRLAPEVQRVDITAPTFSQPIPITNRLFPVSDLHSVVLVGALSGVRWRAETTLLPGTSSVDWNGQHIETLRSQFVAYLGGRIFEVAVDHYAQADDGSVWYLGEDAFTYKKGRAANTEGTWLAGVNGPPALIMPADPRVGAVYRTENIPGLVFEQVTVKHVGQTLIGPTGPVAGAMIGQELHADEVRLEDKTFAPGYGEFHSGQGSTFEATALAVPTDALSQPTPAGLVKLYGDATSTFEEARSGNWGGATASQNDMNAAWNAVRAARPPAMLADQMTGALAALARAVGARDPRAAPLAALDVARASLDLELRYRAPVQVDAARFDLWTRQLQVDAAAGAQAGAIGDATTLQWIRDRIGLAGDGALRVEAQLRTLEAMVESGELAAAADAAARLRESLAGLVPA